MIWFVLLVLLPSGMFLSAFFSGSETGFYRVSRVRLALDARSGDLIARGLLALTNQPALFVATTLIGNNLANYLTSLAIVLAVRELFSSQTPYLAELMAPVLLSPLVFVYGELLPKNLFYQAPNRLLHRGGPLFLACTALFAPVSAVLWALGKLLEVLLGQTPLRVQRTLARKELQRVLREGEAVGILQPAQQRLAQSLFSVAAQPVKNLCIPTARVTKARIGSRKEEVLQLARNHGLSIVPVTESQGRDFVGYVRIVDLYLDGSETIQTVRPLPELPQNETHIAALLHLQSSKEDVAHIVNAAGQSVGMLYASDLTEPLFHGE